MEFSFNRPNEPIDNGIQAKTASDDGIDTSTISNERLRKAIEKNRARQAERTRTMPKKESTFQQQEQNGQNGQASLFDKQAPPSRPHAEERSHSANTKSTNVITRRTVARADEADFTPVKRTSRKVASQLDYAVKSRKKSKALNPLFAGYLVKGCWAFCLVMILRLIFAQGGVVGFYTQRSLYNDRLAELDRIKKENMQYVHEIERMQSDGAFQKKLVRDNLGFIAADEYLVLFPKEKSVQ